jgi:hypothetical protein
MQFKTVLGISFVILLGSSIAFNIVLSPKSEIVTRQYWHLVKPDTRKEQMP